MSGVEDTAVAGEAIAGVCPSCHTRSLMTGAGGHVICTLIGCLDPGITDRMLGMMIPPDRLIPEHTITLKSEGWHLAHPITCVLGDCEFDAVAASWEAAPREQGSFLWADLEQLPHEWMDSES